MGSGLKDGLWGQKEQLWTLNLFAPQDVPVWEYQTLNNSILLTVDVSRQWTQCVLCCATQSSSPGHWWLDNHVRAVLLFLQVRLFCLRRIICRWKEGYVPSSPAGRVRVCIYEGRQKRFSLDCPGPGSTPVPGSLDTTINKALASIWMCYSFRVNGPFVHGRILYVKL